MAVYDVFSVEPLAIGNATSALMARGYAYNGNNTVASYSEVPGYTRALKGWSASTAPGSLRLLSYPNNTVVGVICNAEGPLPVALRYTRTVSLTISVVSSTLSIAYNPSGTVNDINTSIAVPTGAKFVEVVPTATTLSVFVNNKEVFSFTFSDSIPSVFNEIWLEGRDGARVYAYYAADTRLGMVKFATATLGAPSADTSASVTGAATRQAALSSFDDDTSHVTYTEGSGQETKMPISVSGLPSDAAVHAIKLTASAAGAGGVAAGRLQVEAPAGTANTVPINMAVSYGPTTAVYQMDINADPFLATDINAGNIRVGVVEGA